MDTALSASTSTIGLMFGSYNPPHLAHVRTAQKLKVAGGLTEVWMLPVPTSPFKKHTPQARFDEKLEMCAILADPYRTWLKPSDACKNFPSGVISQLQQYKRTLEQIFTENSGARFKVIAGDDFTHRLNAAVQVLAYFDMMASAVKKSSVVHLQILDSYASRLTHAYDVLRGVEILSTERSQVEVCPSPEDRPIIMEVSSARIRKALETGAEIIPGLPPSLHEYINSHGLYQGTQNHSMKAWMAP